MGRDFFYRVTLQLAKSDRPKRLVPQSSKEPLALLGKLDGKLRSRLPADQPCEIAFRGEPIVSGEDGFATHPALATLQPGLASNVELALRVVMTSSTRQRSFRS